MNVLALDFETTSLDTKKAEVIEIGASLYAVTEGSWVKIASANSLVYTKEPLQPDTIRITGITQELLDSASVTIEHAFKALSDLAMDAEMAVAHNASYDKDVLINFAGRHALTLLPGINNLLQIPWLCSKDDIRSNKDKTCKRLSHLALDYGLAVDPANLHRAGSDVELMVRMLDHIRACPTALLEYKNNPSHFLAAQIPAPWEDGGKGKDAAVKLGYGWQKAKGTDGPEFPKTWVKKIKDCDLEEERKLAPFHIKIIQVR